MKIFISYSRIEASETANTVYTYLKEFRHEVFIDTSGIRGGDEWWYTIQNAISDCDIFVIIVSRTALERQYIREEVELAKNLKKKIIPCIAIKYVKPEELQLGLNKFHGINYKNFDELNQELGDMIASIEKNYKSNPLTSTTKSEYDLVRNSNLNIKNKTELENKNQKNVSSPKITNDNENVKTLRSLLPSHIPRHPILAKEDEIRIMSYKLDNDPKSVYQYKIYISGNMNILAR